MHWNPEQLTEDAFALVSITSTNDPRRHPWGVCLRPDAPPACGGGGHFLWQPNLSQTLALVSDHSSALFMTFGEDEREWLAFRDRLRAIAADFTNQPSRCLAALNRELAGLLQVEWIGTYQELRSGGDPFCQRIRTSFLADAGALLSERSTRKISASEEQAFCAWLAEYGA